MGVFKNFIRGGQTNIHQFRMARQIVWIGFFLPCFMMLMIFSWKTYQIVPKHVWKQAGHYYQAKTLILLPDFIKKNSTITFTESNGFITHKKPEDILNNYVIRHC